MAQVAAAETGAKEQLISSLLSRLAERERGLQTLQADFLVATTEIGRLRAQVSELTRDKDAARKEAAEAGRELPDQRM